MKPKPEKICPEKAPEKPSLTQKVLNVADLVFTPTSFVRHYNKRHPGETPDKNFYPILFCELTRIAAYAGILYEAKNMIFPSQ